MCTQRILDPKTGYSYSCRLCDQCRRQACNDIKGRLCCEFRTAQLRGWAAYFVTLTYGSDDRYYGPHQLNPRSQAFYWEDIRQWRQRLWNAGYPHRAYIVGEVADAGSGRIHWHIVVVFIGNEQVKDRFGREHTVVKVPPNIILSQPGSARLGMRGDYKRYIHWLETPADVDPFHKVQRDWRDTSGGKPLWTHGWSTWEILDDTAIGYTTAYLMKNGRIGDTGIGGRGYCGRKYYGGSTKPPLGSDYFRDVLAPKYIEAGLSPQDAMYRLPEVRKKNGDPFDFFLPPGATRRIYLDAFVRGWIEANGNDHWPHSDMLDNHVDDMLRRERRAAGVPDVPDGVFNDEFYLRRFAKGGRWKRLAAVSAEDRERFRLIRSLQDAGFDIDVPADIAEMFGQGNKKERT